MNKVASLIIFCSLIPLLVSACADANKCSFSDSSIAKLQKKIDAIPMVVNEKEYTRDSLQIANSIRWGFVNDGFFFNTEVRLGVHKSKEINIYVDRIFYSPDTSQIFAIVIVESPSKYAENPNAIASTNSGYYYGGITVVSSRKQDGKWILYPLSWYRPMGWSCYSDIQHLYYNFFLKEMLTTKYFDYYQCTIDQECFWSERNGYWRMGKVIPGYYNFEVKIHSDYFKATKRPVDSTNVNEYLHHPLQEW